MVSRIQTHLSLHMGKYYYSMQLRDCFTIYFALTFKEEKTEFRKEWMQIFRLSISIDLIFYLSSLIIMEPELMLFIFFINSYGIRK